MWLHRNTEMLVRRGFWGPSGSTLLPKVSSTLDQASWFLSILVLSVSNNEAWATSWQIVLSPFAQLRNAHSHVELPAPQALRRKQDVFLGRRDFLWISCGILTRKGQQSSTEEKHARQLFFHWPSLQWHYLWAMEEVDSILAGMTNPLPTGAKSQTVNTWDWRWTQPLKRNTRWYVCTYASISLACIFIFLLLILLREF